MYVFEFVVGAVADAIIAAMERGVVCEGAAADDVELACPQDILEGTADVLAQDAACRLPDMTGG